MRLYASTALAVALVIVACSSSKEGNQAAPAAGPSSAGPGSSGGSSGGGSSSGSSGGPTGPGDGGPTTTVDSGDGGDGGNQGDSGVVATIGPAGGTIIGPNGATIVVPQGALAAATALTIEVVADATAPAGSTSVSATYRLGPEGVAFTQPVKVSLPYDAKKLARPDQAVFLYRIPRDGGAPGLVTDHTGLDGKLVWAETKAFSNWFAITFANSCAEAATSCDPGCSVNCLDGTFGVCWPSLPDKLGGCSPSTCKCVTPPPASCTAAGLDTCAGCAATCSGDTPYASCRDSMPDKFGTCGPSACTCLAIKCTAAAGTGVCSGDPGCSVDCTGKGGSAACVAATPDKLGTNCSTSSCNCVPFE